MSKKQTIAVDIDDVLAAEAQYIIDFSNEHWGHALSLDDFQEHWPEMWGISFEETERRADRLHEPGTVSKYQLIANAHQTLEELAHNYRLIIVTSRRSKTKQETHKWLEKNFRGIFDDVHFTGFYDNVAPDSYRKTKGELLKQLGADFIIDDQLKHCRSAVDNGVTAIVFGDYGHNRNGDLPEGAVRCRNWAEVKAYFDGLAR